MSEYRNRSVEQEDESGAWLYGLVAVLIAVVIVAIIAAITIGVDREGQRNQHVKEACIKSGYAASDCRFISGRNP